MPSAATAVRIFIISEPAIYRAGLGLLVDAEPGFQVVGSAGDYVQACEAARAANADIVLLDLAAPLPSGSEALSILARACTPARIILLVPSLDRDQLLAALLDGVRGVLVKDSPSEVLFRSIRAVAEGQCWIEREAVADLVQRLAQIARTGSAAPQPKSFGLSPRELEIVTAIATGCANRKIAKRLAISEKTVKHHLTHIFEKLSLSNRLELALFAFHHGLATDEPSPPHRRTGSRPARSSKSART